MSEDHISMIQKNYPIAISSPEGTPLLILTSDLEIQGELSDMREAGVQLAKTLEEIIPGILSQPRTKAEDLPVIAIEGDFRYGESPSERIMKFMSDRSFSGVRPCDEEKAKVLWNACMDELESLENREGAQP